MLRILHRYSPHISFVALLTVQLSDPVLKYINMLHKYSKCMCVCMYRALSENTNTTQKKMLYEGIKIVEIP